MTPAFPQPTKRKPLTRREFGCLLMRQEGRCYACNGKLDFSKPRQVVDEHLQALASLGGNELENRALSCLQCAKDKTSKEAPGLAKVRRLSGQKSSQVSRRKKHRSKLQNRSFQKPPEGYKHRWANRKIGQ